MAQTANLTGLYSGGGRLVQGSMTEKQTKEYGTGALIPPEDQEYYFAVAVPKTDPNIGGLLGQLSGLASQHYANSPGIMQQIQMGLSATGFSWKVEDGDTPSFDNQTGQPKPPKEYEAGCYILKFKTKYDWSAARLQPDGSIVEIPRSEIKRGDYVEVMFTASPNGRMDANAGIILYPNSIIQLGIGEAIGGGVSGTAAFGNRAVTAMGQPAGGQPAGMPQQQAQMPQAGMPQQQAQMPQAGMPQQQAQMPQAGMPQQQAQMPQAGMPQQQAQMPQAGMPQQQAQMPQAGMPQQQAQMPQAGMPQQQAQMPQAGMPQQQAQMPQAGMPQQQAQPMGNPQLPPTGAGGQAMTTASPTEAGVQPHPGILGPQG